MNSRPSLPRTCLAIAIITAAALAGPVFEERNNVVVAEAENATTITGWKPISGGMVDGGSGGLFFKINFKTGGKFYAHVYGGTGQGGCPGDGENDCLVKFNGKGLICDGTSVVADGLRFANGGSCCSGGWCWEQGAKVGSHTPDNLKPKMIFLTAPANAQGTFSIEHRSTGFRVNRITLSRSVSKPSTTLAETVAGGSTPVSYTVVPRQAQAADSYQLLNFQGRLVPAPASTSKGTASTRVQIRVSPEGVTAPAVVGE